MADAQVLIVGARPVGLIRAVDPGCGACKVP